MYTMYSYLIFILLILFTYFLIYSSPIYDLTSLKETHEGYEGEIDLVEGHTELCETLPQLFLTVTFITSSILRIRITDRLNKRYEVYPWVLKHQKTTPTTKHYSIDFRHNDFNLIVYSEKDVLLNLTNMNYCDQYITIRNSFVEDIPALYGFGDRFFKFRMDTDNHYYTLWNFGRFMYDSNVYSSHPFYMRMKNGRSNGIFLFNSNAMDIVVNKNIMEYRTIGGVLDYFVFVGPKPIDVIRQYQEIIGTPKLINKFALGWHQCRYGYKNISMVNEVVKKYMFYGIPLDAIWFDIDYMDKWKDFTVSPINFPLDKVQDFVSYLDSINKNLIVIIDPGIKVEKGYYPYDLGVEMDIFTKRKGEKSYVVNSAWPGDIHYPDFFNPKIYDYWYKVVKQFHDKVKIGGGFDGDKYDYSRDKFTDPIYSPGMYSISKKTCAMNAVHYDEDHNIEYNVHNLYGLMEANVTSRVLKEITGKRPFILSRSVWPSAGSIQGLAHWTGDVNSYFVDLKMSIATILVSGMSGVPYVGADVCGFRHDSSRELCIRWTQLAIFYPFARNHNDNKAREQHPWNLDMVNISRECIKMRYSLIPYYYTEFFKISQIGGLLWRSLFFEFPDDKSTYDIDEQFFVGKALLVCPVLYLSSELNFILNIYLPEGVWYNYYDYSKTVMDVGGYKSVKISLDDLPPVFIRGGFIIPTQVPALNTKSQEFNDYTLTIAYDKTNKAEGFLYLDNGEDLEIKYTYIKYFCEDNTLVNKIIKNEYESIAKISITKLIFIGIDETTISEVSVNGKSVKFEFKNGVLKVDDLSINVGDNLIVKYKNMINEQSLIK